MRGSSACWSPAGLASSRSNFVQLMRGARPDTELWVLDKLTYAGNPANLASSPMTRIPLHQGDICDATWSTSSRARWTRWSTSRRRPTSTVPDRPVRLHARRRPRHGGALRHGLPGTSMKCSSWSAPTRCTATCRPAAPWRMTRFVPEALFRQQGRWRAHRPCLRRAMASAPGHSRREHLWAISSTGEGRPRLCPAMPSTTVRCLGNATGQPCGTTSMSPTTAPRSTSSCTGPDRPGVQRRQRCRDQRPGARRSRPGAGCEAGVAHPVRRRPQGP